MNDDILLCYDLTRPEEDRAPFCTKVAKEANLVEGISGVGPDMYFCDACFDAGNAFLNIIQLGLVSGQISMQQVTDAYANARARQEARAVKKGKN